MQILAPCDLCGGKEFKVLYPSSIPDNGLEANHYYSSSRRSAGHLDIVRCNHCHLVMTNPRDDKETRAAIYTRLVDHHYEGEEHNRRKTAQDYLRFVSRYGPPQGRLLDIGCSTGIFLSEAQKAGWEISGVEVSRWSLDKAHQRLEEAALVHTPVEESNFPPGAFEVITLWDVLEHLDQPSSVLQKLNGWLAPGGMVFLNLPNIDSMVARLTRGSWALLLREHLWYYSPKTIKATLSKHGFEIIHQRANFVRFSVGTIYLRLCQYPNAVGRLLHRITLPTWVRNLSFRFPMGEVQVAARKIMR